MTRTERAIAILKDAEPVFRLKPERKSHNHSGLCLYTTNHQLGKRLTDISYNKLIELMLTDGRNKSRWWFCGNQSQHIAWDKETSGYESERSDFCLKRIKELEK
ncbi:hypothetical protein LCGC14_1683270 [marine sediment metagenome]|uniref:Uncharacterized protein n=1 Tax=marine sediment metagenome TaxID=412755 RepID=A0A0F9HNG4_9ZZZZ|nr:hypothetical protein [Candidatus Scalindua sp.]